MIPKTIHYCWLSDETIPQELQSCMATWKQIMPDYQQVLWDQKKFDISSVTFVKEACEVKKWAFAADYIRIFALHAEGGIYLDVDVIIRKSFTEFLNADFFTAIEYHDDIVKNENTLLLLNDDGTPKSAVNKPGIGIQAAILGGIKGHPFLEDCLRYYENKHFVNPGGGFFDEFIAPGIFAMIAEKYGFRYLDERQELDANMLILSSDIFSSEKKSTSYAIHNCYGSWRDIPKISSIRKLLNRFF